MIITCLLLVVGGAKAQNTNIFLFEKFSLARVYFKNGATTKAQMNYDALKGKMFYMQGEDFMELTNVNMIDTVSWGGRKFIPAGKRFYEVFTLRNVPIFVDWLLKDIHLGSKGAFGLPTQGTVQTLKLGDFTGGVAANNQNYDPQGTYKKDCWRRRADNTYYIQIEGKLQRVRTVKNLRKLFKEHDAEIKQFADEQKTDMKIVEDALKLIDYCLSLQQ